MVSPVLFFSDLVDGPRTGWNGSATKGAAVSIWGLNFGSSRGGNYVTVAGQQLTSAGDYAEWGVTTNNARSMERITFWLNSSCTSGAQTISVTVGGVTSNTLAFYVRTTGNIRFVDHTNGSDSYNGTLDVYVSGSNGPWKTLSHARTSMSGGQVLYIRAGTYTECDDEYSSMIFISTSQDGAANAMTAFVGYPGELPLLDTRSGTSEEAIRNNYNYDGGNYMVFSKMKCYPYGVVFDVRGAASGYFRVVGLEADGISGSLPHASTWQGCFNFQNMSHAKLLGCKIHDWGRDKYDHATYFGCNSGFPNTNTSDCEYAYNEIYNLGTEVSGLYCHPVDSGGSGYATDVYMHDNHIYSLSHAAVFFSSRVLNAYVYNNIIENCGSASAGRYAVYYTTQQTPTSNIRFFNNTIYTNVGAALVGYGGGGTDTYSNISSLNNIYYSLSGVNYVYLDGSGHGTVTSNYDIYYGDGAKPAWAGANCISNQDPQMTSPATGDFSLSAGSRSIGAGTTTVNTILTTDYNGLIRGSSCDLGALEYAAGSLTDVSRIFYDSNTFSDRPPQIELKGYRIGQPSPPRNLRIIR
jgi:hypothetical protein